jgi:diguanylate cyclase (GGDEF)-like protein/PAS domain S-box-containing protein
MKKNFITLRDRVRLIRIQLFFRNAAGNAFAFSLCGLLFVLVLRSAQVPDFVVLAWLALILLGSGLLSLFQAYVKRIGLSLANAERFFFIRAVLGVATFSGYGLAVFLLPQQTAETAYTFAFIIASMVMAVCFMNYVTVYSYCMLINAVTLLPLTLFYFYRYFNAGGNFFLLMGLTAIVWQFAVAGKALQVSRAAVGAIIDRERLSDEMAERRQAELALRDSEEKSQRLASMLRLICDNVPDMIWAKDVDNRYVFANKALCETLLDLVSTDEPLGKTFDFFVQRERSRHPDDPEWYTYGQFSQDIDRHTLSRDEPTIFEESGNVFGSFVFLEVHQARFINAHGEVIGTVGCARDITERKASEAFVQHLAHHDVLTDLPNRALLTDRLRQALAQARRDRGELAVLFLDLDRLKPVNDTFGHDIGDLLLKEVANRLREAVMRQSDTVSRVGGDEFVILLQRVNTEQDAVAVARKILHALSQPFAINQHEIMISGSIGIAIYPQHGDVVDLLLRNADSAMYSAKNSGRNAYQFFDASMARAPGL